MKYRVAAVLITSLIFAVAIVQLAFGLKYLIFDSAPDRISQLSIQLTMTCVSLGILAAGIPLIIRDFTSISGTSTFLIFLIIMGLGFAALAYMLRQEVEVPPLLDVVVLTLMSSGANFVFGLEWDR